MCFLELFLLTYLNLIGLTAIAISFVLDLEYNGLKGQFYSHFCTYSYWYAQGLEPGPPSTDIRTNSYTLCLLL
jgi:hypothetical protein